MKLNIIERSDESLEDAKQRMRDAAHAIDPLAPMRHNPMTTVGVGLISGFLLGSKEHPAIMKTLRLSMSLVGLMKPALLAAGKVAARRAVTKVAERAMDEQEQAS